MQYLFPVLNLLVLISYYYAALCYCSRGLVGFNKSKLRFMAYSCVNGITITATYAMHIPLELIILIIFILFFLEVHLMSKTTIRQSIFGAASFIINIACTHALTLVITLYLVSQDIFSSDLMNYISYIYSIITYAVLALILGIVNKITSIPALRQVALSKPNAEHVYTMSILMTIHSCLTIWFLSNTHFETAYLTSTIVLSLFMYTTFFCLFFFNVRSVELTQYKRKSDHAKVVLQENAQRQSLAERRLYTDELTGLYNRLFIERQLEEYCKQSEFDFGVIYCDIAGLKHVNDHYGHKAGDKYIMHAVDILKKSIRPDDYIARVGGDEFIILLHDAHKNNLADIQTRIRQNIGQGTQDSYLNFRIHVNLGYIFVARDQIIKDMDSIIDQADMHMRDDKRRYYQGDFETTASGDTTSGNSNAEDGDTK